MGVGLALGRGHIGLTIKDECKPIPVEKTEENIAPHTLSSAKWEFLILINPRHKVLPLQVKNFASLYKSMSVNTPTCCLVCRVFFLVHFDYVTLETG